LKYLKKNRPLARCRHRCVNNIINRTENRWEDDVKSDITKTNITNWRDCIKNRSKWKEFVEKAKLLWSCSALRRRRSRA
jgi:hypothetical protein